MWDLEGTCPYYKVTENLSVPRKKTVPIYEMKYPKSTNPKQVYFLLLKLYKMSDYGIVSRNFYWLHLPGGDYKLLEPYRNRKIPLKITSTVFMKGSSYEIEMHVQNKSKKTASESLTDKNNFIPIIAEGDFDMASTEAAASKIEEKQEPGLFRKICCCLTKGNDNFKVAELNGTDDGVAFFLYFSVHASSKEHKEGDDTRILPVHYSDNYFSLVPGEQIPIKITFEVPHGVTPRVTLQGWNYHVRHTIL